MGAWRKFVHGPFDRVRPPSNSGQRLNCLQHDPHRPQKQFCFLRFWGRWWCGIEHSRGRGWELAAEVSLSKAIVQHLLKL
eukprot:2054716-Rhodomonas_salina.2